ncbi:zinc ribbon domain-containing protein [Peptostreptococcus faecalis]|uniref:zinc ribbon domain-containing protein n=1 Tax=Peptostreptococcus faecalis TaxID=2045015 RepID=UPI000C7C55D9|nr:zinc ribbon domain-containing protein [Peptostreptococcus faecalis]
MSEKFCQSCAMPLGNEKDYGTNADGSRNDEYCNYCYENGEFTFSGTMEEMIEICVKPMLLANKGMTEEQVRNSMKGYFPTLKRWK